MRFNSLLFNQHRKGPIPTGADAYHAGRGGMEICMMGYQKTDGIYYMKATAKDPTGQAYFDMTTDGGGWMLIARTDPRTTAGNIAWGWLAPPYGSVSDFSQAYLGDWSLWHNAGARFTEFIYGNRKNIGNNQWGPFIYKRSEFSYQIAGGYDGLAVAGTNSPIWPRSDVIKADLSVYNYSNQPSMQGYQGCFQDTSYHNFFMRDVIGNSNLSYGVHSDGMLTTYVNNTDPGINGGNGWQLAGPWAIAGTYNATTGDFDQTDGAGNSHYGGTNQVMIMVRNSAKAY